MKFHISIFLFLPEKENYGLSNHEKEIQGKNDGFCGCSCHRFWGRCWYCIWHWVSLVQASGPLLDAATKVCGLSKTRQWESETRWWNEQVDEAIREKHARFKAYSALTKGGMTAEAKGAKTAYIDAKLVAKHDAWLAKSEAKKEVFATVSPDCDGALGIAKQMDCTNQDVLSENCVHDDAGVLVLTHTHSMHLTIVICYIKACETELPNNLHFFILFERCI